MAELGFSPVLTRAGGIVRPLRRPGSPPSTATRNPPPRAANRQRAAVLREATARLERGVAMIAEVKRRQRSRFPSLAANLTAIRDAAGRAPRDCDGRLVRAPSGSYEGDGPSGGFLVQTDFAASVIGSVYSEAGSILAAMSDLIVVAGGIGARKFPAVDETSRADGSRWGGLTSYWATEADTVSPSFPRFRNLELSPKKVVAAVKCTNELLEDATLFEAFINRALPAELGFRVDRAILFGTGAGQPLGIINAPATIIAPAETGQATATISAANVQSMYARLPLTSRRTAAWLVGEDAELQLAKLVNSDSGSTALTICSGRPCRQQGAVARRVAGNDARTGGAARDAWRCHSCRHGPIHYFAVSIADGYVSRRRLPDRRDSVSVHASSRRRAGLCVAGHARQWRSDPVAIYRAGCALVIISAVTYPRRTSAFVSAITRTAGGWPTPPSSRPAFLFVIT